MIDAVLRASVAEQVNDVLAERGEMLATYQPDDVYYLAPSPHITDTQRLQLIIIIQKQGRHYYIKT